VFTNRFFLGSLGFSVFLHVVFFGWVKFHKQPVREAVFDEIREVQFYDPSQRPEVAGVVGGGGSSAKPAGGPQVGGGGGGGGRGGGSAYMPAIPGYKDLTDDQVVSIKEAMKMAGQAKVNAGRYELDDGGGMDVIRLASTGSGGRQLSTDEILSSKPLELARGVAGSGGGGGSGYTPYLPGGGTPNLQPEELAPAPSISAADLNKRIERSRKEVVPEQSAPSEQVTTKAATKPSITISGQISSRKRLRCGLPKYPAWAVQQGASGTVVIRLYVSPDGSVKENLTVESTSGYPDLDQLVLNTLRGWQFAPLDPATPQEDQWGRITVRFVLG
jgi:TonB family protein